MRQMKWALLGVMAAAVCLLSGCMLKTVEEMYCLPKRTEEYNNLQTAIDRVMTGLEYSSPISGENQQTVQMSDLNGDGELEALVFAKGNGEKPLKIFIFAKQEGVYTNIATIETAGTAFEQVEYAQIDDSPGMELAVGRQVSNEVLHALTVYSFRSGQPDLLLTANYTRFSTTDLNQDDRREIFLLRPGASAENGVAELYFFRRGSMERSREAAMSVSVDKLKRIAVGNMDQDTPAVFVASVYNEDTIITDVFAVVKNKFTNVSLSSESGTSVQTIRNYYVYADDIDDDGLIELPSLISMPKLEPNSAPASRYLIRWYNLTTDGGEREKIYTYHNYTDGWYMRLEEDWIETLTVSRGREVGETLGYVFTGGPGPRDGSQVIFTIYAFTGDDRESLAIADGRFVLARTDEVIYAAAMGSGTLARQLDQQTMISYFNFIREDWKTGET